MKFAIKILGFQRAGKLTNVPENVVDKLNIEVKKRTDSLWPGKKFYEEKECELQIQFCSQFFLAK
jgi:uncharacterized protein YccT (UPF0319 family)